MSAPTDSGYRVKRPLTEAELDRLHTTISNATNTTNLYLNVFRTVYGALLADVGATIDNLSEDNKLIPGQYAIPTSQWQAITTAVTDRAAAWGAGVLLVLDLIQYMPAHYEDPHTPAPDWTRIDHRPPAQHLELSRDAVDAITACETHLDALARAYGSDSTRYQDALRSWHRNLILLFGLGFGDHTRVSRDGHMSLFAHTSSGFVYAIIFHGHQRHCTTPGCAARINDDGTVPDTDATTVLDHEHTPSYPLDAPQPGSWSHHS